MLTTILKRQVKALKKHTNLKHAQCQALLAHSYRCVDYYEFQQLISKRPDDKRLVGASLNPSSLPGTADGWLGTLQYQAKVLCGTLGLPMSDASDLVAAIHGFIRWDDIQYQTLDDLISSENVFYKIDYEIGEELSAEIAGTNASAYRIDDYEILGSSYDENLRQFSVSLNITYTGEQDEDRPWCGDQFHPTITAYFERENGQWSFDSLGLNSVQGRGDDDYGAWAKAFEEDFEDGVL
nr:hypothetical protein 3 [bacterium]